MRAQEPQPNGSPHRAGSSYRFPAGFLSSNVCFRLSGTTRAAGRERRDPPRPARGRGEQGPLSHVILNPFMLVVSDGRRGLTPGRRGSRPNKHAKHIETMPLAKKPQCPLFV